MLKKSALRKIIVSSIALLLLLVIYLIPNNKSLEHISVVHENTKELSVYLLDNNKYVSRISIDNVKDDIESVIELLTIKGNYYSLLPIGFTAIIPKGTKLIDYNIQNNILNLNFSEQFLNVLPEDEERLIESLTYTLCEFEDINGITISVNDIPLNALPHSKKSLPSILDYNYGINKSYNLNSIKNTSQVTIYYLGNYQNYNYFIPVTKISNNTTNKVETIISELKITPFSNAHLSNYLKVSYELEQYEILENSIKLTFNNQKLAGLEDELVEEEIKYALTLSIRDSYNINDITISIK